MFKMLALVSLFFLTPKIYADCTTSDCQFYQEDFATLIKNYKDIYCYTDLKQSQFNKNFDTLSEKYVSQLSSNMTAEDYIWHVRKWGAEFHDGHVNFLPSPHGMDYRVTKFDISLIALAPATPQETLVVASSKDPRIPVGSIINQINGKPALDVVTEATPYFSGSTDRMIRRNAAIGVLSQLTVINKTVQHKLSITMPNKETQDIEVRGTQIPYGSDPSDQVTKTVNHEILSGGILHISISQFIGSNSETDGTADEFTNMMDSLDMSQVKAVVLDLRYNRGGSTTEYEKILGYFTKKEINTYNVSPRINETTKEYRPYLNDWPLISGTDYGVWQMNKAEHSLIPSLADLPIITLISHYCFSACDTMVAALKSNKIGTIMGEPTAGGTGTPIVFELTGSEHSFRYSTIRGKTLEDTYIEGVGSQPDIYIPQTIKDIQDQRDYQLEAAIAYFTPNTLSLIHRLPMQKISKPVINPLKFSAEAYEQYLSGAIE